MNIYDICIINVVTLKIYILYYILYYITYMLIYISIYICYTRYIYMLCMLYTIYYIIYIILLTYVEGITAPWYIIFHIRELFEYIFPILSPY